MTVVDVETTGLSARDEIVELAVVVLDSVGSEIFSWDSLIRPGVPMSPDAARLNGLTEWSLRRAPTFREVAGDVAALLDGACFVAHNASFDLRMLRGSFERIGVRFEVERPIDTYKATRRTLEKSLQEQRIAAPTLHRALADARATAELLRRIAGRLQPGTPARLTPRPESTGVLPVPRQNN